MIQAFAKTITCSRELGGNPRLGFDSSKNLHFSSPQERGARIEGKVKSGDRTEGKVRSM